MKTKKNEKCNQGKQFIFGARYSCSNQNWSQKSELHEQIRLGKFATIARLRNVIII